MNQALRLPRCLARNGSPVCPRSRLPNFLGIGVGSFTSSFSPGGNGTAGPALSWSGSTCVYLAALQQDLRSRGYYVMDHTALPGGGAKRHLSKC
jgi:hypothetical protein